MSSQKDKSLTISADEKNGMVRLYVRDTGHGLAGQTIEQLQEPFHTSKPSGEGMGLGLAISADIIREHGGTLTATDRENGAEFVVQLPIAKDQD